MTYLAVNRLRVGVGWRLQTFVHVATRINKNRKNSPLLPSFFFHQLLALFQQQKILVLLLRVLEMDHSPLMLGHTFFFCAFAFRSKLNTQLLPDHRGKKDVCQTDRNERNSKCFLSASGTTRDPTPHRPWIQISLRNY
jgi:hypothetical protein